MNKTNIEWVKNPDGTQGSTWNPITGCLNGCDYCYARRLANGRLKQRYLANENIAPLENDLAFKVRFKDGTTAFDDPFYPRFWDERLEKLVEMHRMGRRIPKGIFVCDMSDLFGVGIPEEWTGAIFDAINKCPDWRFYLLTKQPQNLAKWSPFPDNCWVGVTATNYTMFSYGLEALQGVQAKVKYMSLEPMLDRLNIPLLNEVLINCGINWLIIGAQTKPYKPPRIEWVKEIVDAADRAGVPVFLKDNLKPLLIVTYLSGNYRQEMP